MYKYYLDKIQWKEFFIGGKEGIFSIFSTSSGIDKNKLNCEKGKIPYITRTEMDNGINLFITGKQNDRYKIDDGNVITIGLDTQTVFYQKNDFYTGQNVQVLKCPELNEKRALFIIPLIKIQMEKFNWGGNGATLSRLNRTKILLPVNEQEEPNWLFMENYIKERENKQRNDLYKYYKDKLLDLVVCPEILADVEWGEFFIEEVAEIVSGKDIYEKERVYGKNPYITSTANNNGIGYFINNENHTKEASCISVNRNGSVGYAFYHPYEALYSNDTRKIRPLINNEYISMFISFAITSQRAKYGYGYKMGTGRLKRQKIMLPTINGEVNYKYMEEFIKKVKKNKIEKILKYLDKYIYIYIMHNHFRKTEWKEFFINEIFDISSGVRLTKADMIDGKTPFIGATDSNNGITGFVGNSNNSFDRNVLGVNYNGSVVENFYHPYSCIFSDDVKRLHLKNCRFNNEYVLLFLKTLILQQKDKYTYGYKFNTNRMQRQKILIPIDSQGNPNYTFMEYQTKRSFLVNYRNYYLRLIK